MQFARCRGRRQVVLVEFPRPGLHSIGFITGAQKAEALEKTRKRLLCVFVPTPPLTSGSIVLVPEADVVKLDMSVADGLKFIMSLGAVSPDYLARELVLTAATGGSRGLMLSAMESGGRVWNPSKNVHDH